MLKYLRGKCHICNIHSEGEHGREQVGEREGKESMQTWQIVNEGMYKFSCTILSILLYVKKFENTDLGEISPSK